MRLPFRARWLFWIIPVLLLAGGAWKLASMRGAEDAALARADMHLERRELESALESLAPFREHRMLSNEGRRRAALLFFQLGEDREAHRMLLLQKPDPKSAEDQRLQEWAAHCQRAQQLVAKAGTLKDPEKRRALIDEALLETPDAPHLLRRLVEEDLFLMSVSKSAAVSEQFARDYLELRSKAPQLAAQVKEKAARSLAKWKP